MSIFGIKRKKLNIQLVDKLNREVKENHEWVKPRLIDTFQRQKALDSRVSNIETDLDSRVSNIETDLVSKVDNIETNINANHTWIKPRLIDAARSHNALVNRVNDISDRNVINIFVELQGALKRGLWFSFGDRTGISPAGYIMAFPGQILAFGLIGKRTNLDDDINIIIVTTSGNPHRKISLTNSELSTHEKFDIPLKVNVGDEIKFMCTNDSPSSTSTVVSIIIELFI